MLTTLAFRHLWVKKLRALFLLLGYALGVGVMIVLLSVGEAMLDQSRDVSLVGGGEVTVLPQGIDIEAMRTGGLGGMFFAIDRARYVGRQILGGPRHAGMIRAVSPVLENQLVYLSRGGLTVAARAGGEVPSRAGAAGAGLHLLAGGWRDQAADSAYIAPSPQQLYDEIDRFHLPSSGDSSWGEWHYFNLVTAPDEWWYLSYLVGGSVRQGRWGGQLLVTHRRPDGRYERFTDRVPAQQVRFDTAAADLVLGESLVQQRRGRYSLRGLAQGAGGRLRFDLVLTPAPHQYFPPVALREGDFVSGYVVPALRARVSGRICLNGCCLRVREAPGYHDHNWGVWREVTWDWGSAQGSRMSLLYGAVHPPERRGGGPASTGAPPFFVTLVDSMGIQQVLRAREIRYAGTMAAAGPGGAAAPAGFVMLAAREPDTVRIRVKVSDALATNAGAAGFARHFLQMRGRFELSGTLGGSPIADSGSGFFETYLPAPRKP